MLAIYKCLTYFRNILLFADITVYTDNRNIINDSDLTKRTERWKLILSEFKFKLIHISGIDNQPADALSRLHTLTEEEIPLFFSPASLAELQKDTEPHLKERFNGIQEDIQNECLFVDDRNRVIIPVIHAQPFVEEFHLHLQHPGTRALYENIHNYFYIPGIKNRITSVTTDCEDCQTRKRLTFAKHGKLSGNLYCETPFKRLSTDIIGPFQSNDFTEHSYGDTFSIITFTDLCTRYTEVFILEKANAGTVLKSLKAFKEKNNITPSSILSDNGRQYTSTLFSEGCQGMGIRNKYTSPYNPQGNGVSERINQQIADTVRIHIGTPLDQLKEKIERKINLNTNRNLNMTPQEAKDGYSTLGPLKRPLFKKLEESKKRMLKITKAAEGKRNAYRKEHIFKIGDKVWKTNIRSGKTQPFWLGPFEVLEVLDENRIRINENGKESIINIKRVRPCFMKGRQDDVRR